MGSRQVKIGVWQEPRRRYWRPNAILIIRCSFCTVERMVYVRANAVDKISEVDWLRRSERQLDVWRYIHK